MDSYFDSPATLERAAFYARQCAAIAESVADVADSVAANLERLAATYRWMADTSQEPDTTERLLRHAARLDDRVVSEHAAARRFRHMFD